MRLVGERDGDQPERGSLSSQARTRESAPVPGCDMSEKWEKQRTVDDQAEEAENEVQHHIAEAGFLAIREN